MSSAVAEKPATIPWWIVLIQGIAAVIIGVLLLTNPLQTAAIIVWSVGLYWVFAGILSLVRIFTDRGHTFWKLFSGIIGIIAGCFLMTNVGDGAVVIFGVTVIIVLAIQGIIMGIIGLIEAFQGGGWGPGILGAISIIIGILLLGSPLGYAAVLPWVIGIFAIGGGIFAVIMAFRLRKA